MLYSRLSDSKPFKYVVRYNDALGWEQEIILPAESLEDAEERLRRLKGNGRVVGQKLFQVFIPIPRFLGEWLDKRLKK